MLQSLQIWSFQGGFVTPALGAVPLPLGLVCQLDTIKVKPLDGTRIIVAANHFAIRHLLAQAVCGLIWVYGLEVVWNLCVLLHFPLLLLLWFVFFVLLG